jgi:hypothetical protein
MRQAGTSGRTGCIDNYVASGLAADHNRVRRPVWATLRVCAVLAVVVAVAAACKSSGQSAEKKLAERLNAYPSARAEKNSHPGVVAIPMVVVGHPGNHSVGIKPFKSGPYKNCSQAPAGKPDCLMVGGVGHNYMIGELETTVAQYVTFLNTVDPSGKNPLKLWVNNMSPTVWPKYGSIRRNLGASYGHHYSVAFPEWANKPVGFVDFIGTARFANSLSNGTVLSRTTSTSGGFTIYTYKVRLSPDTQTGMYNLNNPATGRTSASGFVIPSQDEWIKAAYFDPRGGGKYSYWEYPTGPSRAPQVSKLNPSNGNVANAGTQPQAGYSPQGPAAPLGPTGATGAKSGTYPYWCPPQAGKDCSSRNPLGLSATKYQENYQGNLQTVGQAGTRSPWGTLDQAGNAVEWTDTISPIFKHSPRITRRMHGGVSNAKAYQLKIQAIGPQPEVNAIPKNIYPWLGFRVGVIGNFGNPNR